MLQGTYDFPLVLISIFVAMLASYTGLNMAGRVAARRRAAERTWLVGGAIAMGTGIWAMHFIGMLAFELPIPLGYDFTITTASWLLPIIASALALWLVRRPSLPVGHLIGGALLFGLGINGMHYLGMAAMLMQPGIDYDPGLVLASLFIAIGAAAAAIWIAFRLRVRRRQVGLLRAGAAVVMGFAIVGMHYTGMAAANFPIGSVCMAAGGGFTGDVLATLVIVATIAVLVVALLTAGYDARLEARSQVLAITEATSEERKILLLKEQAARGEAERMGRLKDEFLATLSHELRTPLNAILGWAQILQKNHDESRLRRGLEIIERNALAQAQLIDDLLDMNRIVSGNVRLEMRVLEPVSFIRTAMDSIRPAALAKDIALQERIDHDLAAINGDFDRLQQVMSNLLSNAVKFTSAGGTVSVHARQVAGAVEVSVEDTGIGISEDFIPYLFDRFRQADASTTRKQSGLGLGLSIVKQLVELHGGTVRASSHGRGHGSQFVVRLPIAHSGLKREEQEQRRSETPAVKRFHPVRLPGIRALVVDDDRDARSYIEQLLSDCEVDVRLASTAEEALGMLEQEAFNIVVSDIAMPDIDGYELMRRIRSLKSQNAAIPAIATTAFARLEDEERVLSSGFNSFVPKPVDPGRLVQEVARLSKEMPSLPYS